MYVKSVSNNIHKNEIKLQKQIVNKTFRNCNLCLSLSFEGHVKYKSINARASVLHLCKKGQIC